MRAVGVDDPDVMSALASLKSRVRQRACSPLHHMTLQDYSYYLQSVISEIDVRMKRLSFAMPVSELLRGPGPAAQGRELGPCIVTDVPDVNVRSCCNQGFHFGECCSLPCS